MLRHLIFNLILILVFITDTVSYAQNKELLTGSVKGYGTSGSIVTRAGTIDDNLRIKIGLKAASGIEYVGDTGIKSFPVTNVKATNLQQAISQESFLCFTIIPKPGFTLNLSDVEFDLYRESVDSPASYAILCTSRQNRIKQPQLIVNNINSQDPLGVGTTNPKKPFAIRASNIKFTDITDAVQLRLYVFNAKDPNKKTYITGVRLRGDSYRTGSIAPRFDDVKIALQTAKDVSLECDIARGTGQLTAYWDTCDRLRTNKQWAASKSLGKVSTGDKINLRVEDLNPGTKYYFRFMLDDQNSGIQIWSKPLVFHHNAIKQYAMSEFLFEAENKSENPYNDIEMLTTFKGPSGQIVNISGFCDGEKSWKVRFSPPAPGSWTYSTACEQDKNLNNKKGAFTVSPASGAHGLQKHGGILKVSNEFDCITYTDGEPFLWIGESCITMPAYYPYETSDIDRIDSAFKYTIDRRSEQGFNIQQWLINDCCLEGSTGINLEVMQNLDRSIEYANEQGIIPFICLSSKSTTQHTIAEWKILWDYIIARYGSYSVGWMMFWEYDSMDMNYYGKQANLQTMQKQSADLAFKVAAYVKANDPYKRAISMFPALYSESLHESFTKDSLGFTVINSGNNMDNWPGIKELRRLNIRSTTKPLIDMGPVFENGYIFTGKNTDLATADLIRKQYYTSFFAGNIGLGYGAHGVWNRVLNLDDSFGLDFGPNINLWYDALEFDAANQIRHFKTALKSLSWFRLRPTLNLNVSDDEAMCLAWQTQEIVVYFIQGTDPQKIIGLENQPGRGILDGHWFSPNTGEKIKLKSKIAIGLKIQLPKRPDSRDWLLILKKDTTR